MVNAIKNAFYALIFLAIILAVLWFHFLSPADKSDTEKIEVIIEKGLGQRGIAKLLKEEGLIKNDLVFLFYAHISDNYDSLQAGTYGLSPSMGVKEITRAISEGKVMSNSFTITLPEGLTVKEMDSKFADKRVFERGEFEKAATMSSDEAYEKYKLEFLSGLKSDTLEGFLFPDTYEFFNEVEANSVVGDMLKNFENKTSELIEKSDSDKSLFEIVIAASLIQGEVSLEEDMRRLAGLINNRLRLGIALRLDSTLVHITGSKEHSIFYKAKESESPYNTYKFAGLTPGPINNPGIVAIKAMLDPEENDYFYFVSANDGVNHFAKTLDEHNFNVHKYLLLGEESASE